MGTKICFCSLACQFFSHSGLDNYSFKYLRHCFVYFIFYTPFLVFWNLSFWVARVLSCKSVELQKCWVAKVLSCKSFELQELWVANVLSCVALSCKSFELQKCWVVKLCCRVLLCRFVAQAFLSRFSLCVWGLISPSLHTCSVYGGWAHPPSSPHPHISPPQSSHDGSNLDKFLESSRLWEARHWGEGGGKGWSEAWEGGCVLPFTTWGWCGGEG